MKLCFGYGKSCQEVEVPEKNLIAVLRANDVDAPLTGTAEVERSLDEPIGAPLIGELVKKGEKIAIITSDITRPCPTKLILPPLLDRLYAAGIDKEDITLFFALGSHRRHTEEEMRFLAGERAWSEIRCADSDPEDLIRLGQTGMGTPVDITREVAEADRRICLGNIEYHYFAGYSGGAKAIMPGVSSRAAIQKNHSMMIAPEASVGRLSGNPIREDIEEAGAICGIDYIVNVVLDESKNIIKAVAGDAVEAHREGCRFLDQIYKIPIDQKADIVLVSQGGAPKDINLYQTQKALDNAKHAVRDGGIIILIGECGEGLGEATFEQWLNEAKTPEDLIERVKKDFRLGGHKAAAIAMVLLFAQIFMVSDMESALVEKCFMRPFGSAQEAFDEAFSILGSDAKVLAMPHGGSTLPYLVGRNFSELP